MGRVRVSFRVAEGVVHSVKHRISTRTQVRRTLRQIRQCVKKTLPEFAHREHLVGRIAVQKERLAKQRQIPMRNERGQYNHNDY